MERRILRWIFNRERAVENLLILLILVGFVLLFKEQIQNLLFGKIGEMDSLINQILK